MEGTAGEKGRDKERREKVRNREGRSKERVRRTIPRVLRETNTDRVAGGERRPEQEMGSQWADPKIET